MHPLVVLTTSLFFLLNDSVESFQLVRSAVSLHQRRYRQRDTVATTKTNLLLSTLSIQRPTPTTLWESPQPSEQQQQRDPGLTWTSVVSHPQPVDGPHGIPSRAQQLQQLQQQQQQQQQQPQQQQQQRTWKQYDVLVVGGGATGAGVALDAATRGLFTACIERGDFASETSSRSTKLIWAGLKYMATAVAALLSTDLFTDPVTTLQSFLAEMNMVLHCHQE